jgi:hypothetical protein
MHSAAPFTETTRRLELHPPVANLGHYFDADGATVRSIETAAIEQGSHRRVVIRLLLIYHSGAHSIVLVATARRWRRSLRVEQRLDRKVVGKAKAAAATATVAEHRFEHIHVARRGRHGDSRLVMMVMMVLLLLLLLLLLLAVQGVRVQ